VDLIDQGKRNRGEDAADEEEIQGRMTTAAVASCIGFSST
jgi:hypothetical protein